MNKCLFYYIKSHSKDTVKRYWARYLSFSMDLDSDRLSDSLSPLILENEWNTGSESITDPQCIIDLLWPLLTLTFICIAFPPRPLGIVIHFQTLLSPLMKVPRMMLLSSLLWWELGTSLPGPGPGPGEWLSFWRVINKQFCFWIWIHVTSSSFHKKLSSSLTLDNRTPGNETFRTFEWGYAWSTTDMASYMVWPGGHDMVYGMVCRAWHGVLPGGHGRIYGMAWRAYHGIWHIICSCLVGNGMVYGMACRA